jgi:2-polyprenyl-6-methoxyphenol hydroxylase-like FAD-dependent oxidoreductase
VPLVGDEVYAFLVANAPRETWKDRAARRGAAVRQRFAGFGGDMPRVLAAIADDDELLHHDIEEVEVPTWSRGAVGLLGDAAHAMTPNFGQGAAMAIEDAIVLARELVAHNDASTALRSYERRRRPRVDELQRGARRLGVVAQWSGPVSTWARNLALRCAPASSSERALEKIVSYVP